MNTAEKITKIRNAKKINQSEFARMLHVSSQHISAIERGIREPSDSLLDLIIAKFGVSTDWWETEEGPIFEGEPPQDELRALAWKQFDAFFNSLETPADREEEVGELFSFLAKRKKTKNVGN